MSTLKPYRAPAPLHDLQNGEIRSTKLRAFQWLATASMVTTLAACGGGGSSPAPAPPPTSACTPSGVTFDPSALPAIPSTPTAFSGPSITLSGIARAEIVPNKLTNGSLDYAARALQPIRGATINIINSTTNALVAVTSTDANGAYSAIVPASTLVFIRVRAQLLKTTTGASWEVNIRDNTQSSAAYAADGAAFTTGAANTTQDITALSGWTGTAYDNTKRSSGPFAITNSIYSAIQKVLSASPNQPFPLLTVFWSINNTASGCNDAAIGLISTTFFSAQNTRRSIFVLGKADSDTDEFDETVIAHEWGHYFQNAFSRDDSVGGKHGSGDKLDGRVAFSEGWGNAWSGMALGRSVYSDSNGASQSKGFSINLAAPEVAANKGWYSEASVQYVLYALSTQATGFTPIWQTMTAPAFVGGTALTQIHSFATALRAVNATAGTSFGTLLTGEQITAADAFGSTDTNSGGIASAIPIYRSTLIVGTPLTNVCTVSTAGVPNKLGNYVAFKFNAPTAKTYTITITGGAATDPDFEIYQNGFRGQAGASTLGSDTTTVALTAGPAVLIFNDFTLAAGAAPSCFTINVQ